LELLTIFYALLAAVTGLGGGDRAVALEPSRVAASADPCAATRLAAVGRAVAVAPAPRPQLHRPRLVSAIEPVAPLDALALPSALIARFGVRRE
jgi:hypothetical protein